MIFISSFLDDKLDAFYNQIHFIFPNYDFTKLMFLVFFRLLANAYYLTR